MSLALLFPGQGSQYPDMLDDLPDSPAVTRAVDEARSHFPDLGLPADIDSADHLRDTTNVQVSLLVSGVASARALTHEHGLKPRFVAGHSVGAFAAAVVAGVLTFGEALTAVRVRGKAMKKACARGDWGMAAVTGLPGRAAGGLANQVGTSDQPLWLANVNSATQNVFSGTTIALQRLSTAAASAGAANVELLDVPVASHCPLQADTAKLLASHLSTVPHRTPQASYLTNVGGRAVGVSDRVLDDLAQSAAHPVQWYDATRLMAELGVTCAIQTAPGHALTRLVKSATPSVIAIALADTGLSASATIARRADRDSTTTRRSTG